jgi:hypothetical protein
MKKSQMSHQATLAATAATRTAATAVPHIPGTHTETTLSPKSEQTIRKWYAAWEKKDWHPLDTLLAENFTFTSAAGDDHISKSAFKAQCWETQIDFIERFDLLRVFGSDDEALVTYVCRTKNGKSFRNVEYLRLKGEKLEAIECYFGEQSSFPSAVSTAR